MKDDKLKKLMESDYLVPEAPADEWSKIHTKLNPSKPWLSAQLIGAVACLLIIVTTTFNLNFSSNNQGLDDSIAEYVLDDIYFESEELYTWIDES